MPFISFIVLAALSGASLASSTADKPLVPAPHPLITEVLYAVPSGKAGDANGDGERQPIGDEFVELINPHDQPINLKGYVLVDADAYSPGAPKPANPNKPGDRKGAEVRFTFPDCELKPGHLAVVFNGYKSTFTGPVGDSSHAPSGPNDRFHNELVFNMLNASPYAAFANDGDFVLLIAPDGKPVQCIRWGGGGKTDKNPPSDCPVIEDAPIAAGSVQRDSLTGKLKPHNDLGGDFKGSPFSPGLFKPAPSDPKPSSTPPAAPTSPTTPDPKPSSKPAPPPKSK